MIGNTADDPSNSELVALEGELLPARLVTEHQIVADVSAWTDADFHLTDRTRAKLRAAIPANTLRAYERWWGAAADWCTARGRIALPMTAQTCTEFIRELTDTVSARTGRTLSVASLDQALAAVRAVHAEAGFEDMPSSRDARRLIRAHGRELADAGRTERKSAIVTADQALDIATRCDPATMVGARDRLLVALSFAAWTRRSELARLNLADVRPSAKNRPGLIVTFRSSKTDQAAKGTEVYLPERGDALCPLAAWQTWTGMLAKERHVDGRLLRKVDRWGNLGAALAPGGVNEISQRLVEQAGYAVDERGRTFTAHGWRASGRSAAVEAGASESAANAHGRWSKNSTVGRGYERDRGAAADHPMAKVAAKQKGDAGGVQPQA